MPISQHHLESFARSCGVTWGRNVPPGERICVASAFHFCAPRTHDPIWSGCSPCCRDADPAICRTAYADAPASASDDFCPAARQVGCDGQEGDQARGPRFKAHMEYARRDRGGAKRRVPAPYRRVLTRPGVLRRSCRSLVAARLACPAAYRCVLRAGETHLHARRHRSDRGRNRGAPSRSMPLLSVPFQGVCHSALVITRLRARTLSQAPHRARAPHQANFRTRGAHTGLCTRIARGRFVRKTPPCPRRRPRANRRRTRPSAALTARELVPQYAGFSTAEESNAFYKRSIAQGGQARAPPPAAGAARRALALRFSPAPPEPLDVPTAGGEGRELQPRPPTVNWWGSLG